MVEWLVSDSASWQFFLEDECKGPDCHETCETYACSGHDLSGQTVIVGLDVVVQRHEQCQDTDTDQEYMQHHNKDQPGPTSSHFDDLWNGKRASVTEFSSGALS